ncbi:DUF6049 family protein [Cellulomonas sp. ATA003]|uniref:DUF6049 family protein n=1 Tax=Cellulomonas sp. ATA003 TaxID=3073064 RepID=UPI002873E5B3|nr:DUF6049 family protein [Cellulomonas sp. ATA003]WNB85601.1 DUF6049 family protein [Cellulomonas sp. ATA003]
MGPADELVVRATVRNGTDDELAAPQASLRVNRFLQSTRGSLDRWADQPLSGTVGDRLVSAPLTGPLAPGQTADVELRVPAGELRLSTADSAWGPRGLSVEVTDGGAGRPSTGRSSCGSPPTRSSPPPASASWSR